jgi:hypothetical protein
MERDGSVDGDDDDGGEYDQGPVPGAWWRCLLLLLLLGCLGGGVI